MDADTDLLYFSNMEQASRSGSIPNYNLYGEFAELPDILHCESISSRAALHDWNIRPHRHARLHQFFVVRSGGGRCEVDGQAMALAPPMLLNIPPLAVHAFAFEPGTEGWVITVPVEVLEAGTEGALALGSLISGAGVARADDGLVGLCDGVAREHGGVAFGRAHALKGYVALVAARAARLLSAARDRDEEASRGSLVRRFEMLVEEHFREHWTVADYARELAISPTHLSRLSRGRTGLSASRVIEARLLREARRSLAYTNMTVAQIAYELGFEDPAYFSRVFTRATGHAPSAYRKRLSTGGGTAKMSRRG